MTTTREHWYAACREAASLVSCHIPEAYRSRTFSGIIGDIKTLNAKQALSLCSRKKGLGLQYAFQYLRTGIDGGRGYQACAAAALDSILKTHEPDVIGECVLDVGCAVGVTAGVLGRENVTGFDLFIDLIRTARLVDSLAGRRNTYFVADMTREWPFDHRFDTVICGLVCHHLKTQAEVSPFFLNANRTLCEGGSLILTFPAGTISSAQVLRELCEGLRSFGFAICRDTTGLVVSTDDSHALFWMFLIHAKKMSRPSSDVFIHRSFSFPDVRTPVSRTEKGARARFVRGHERRVIHERFRLVTLDELAELAGPERTLTFDTVLEISTGFTDGAGD
ncbi:class I SAM-dependent methyltransferase [Candidatus Latescibacterota bacterium]